MKIPLPSWLIASALLLSASLASAEKADRDKPMNVEADALRYDDAQQISVFTGTVVLTTRPSLPVVCCESSAPSGAWKNTGT